VNPDRPDPFADAVDELVAAITQGAEATNQTLSRVVVALERSVIKRGLSPSDATEVAAETITRLVALAQEGRIDERGAAGLLLTIAERLATDTARRAARSVPTAEPIEDRPSDEDQIAALIDAEADSLAIQQALASAFWAEEFELVRIIRVWLDLADDLERAPTSRESAAACGVSHATVQRALKRFSGFVPRNGSQT